MKIGNVTSPTIASPEMPKSTMGMSEKGLEMASWFLRDRIYTDKPLAVVREYISNAVDEHRKHNIERPVEVSLRQEDVQYIWACRDYAKGLDDHGVRFIFGQYFESTKNHSNDAIGGFGVGSKAGHAYCDTFYITSYYEGTKTHYACVLGGGKNGIPVGEIYEIYSEDTEESGIEISLQIGRSQANELRTKTAQIVNHFNYDTDLVFNCGISEEVFVPRNPRCVETHGKYTFNVYCEGFMPEMGSYDKNCYIRMGGIIYETNHFGHVINENSNGVIVVDLPIGSLSLPITREKVEDTKSNNKILEEVNETLKTIRDREKESLSKNKPKVIDMIKGENYGLGNVYIQNDDMFFKYSKNVVYPDEWEFRRHIILRKDLSDDSNIYVFPNIKDTKLWKYRLEKHLNNEPYNEINERVFSCLRDSDNVDFSGLNFIYVKKMGLSKINPDKSKKGEDKKYAIYKNKSMYCDYYTAKELDDEIIEKYGKFDDDWYEKVNTIDDLKTRSIALRCSSEGRFFCNSQKMIKDLVKLGWVEVYSREWNNAYRRIKELERARSRVNGAITRLRGTYPGSVNHSQHLINAVEKNPDKVEKIVEKMYKIKNESSFRGRVLSSFSSYYDRNLTREDIRRILNFKD